MSIYDITYSNVILNLLPPQYRTPKVISFCNALVYPIQWVRDTFFDNYIDSADYVNYISGSLVVVNAGTNVRFDDFSLWQTQVANIDCNVYNPTLNQIYSGSTLLWIKLQEDFIGFNERVMFNNQHLKFEYLLNRYFNNNDGNPYYDRILINTNDTSTPMFSISDIDEDSCLVSENSDDTMYYLSETDDETEEYNFTILVPSEISDRLGADYETIISEIVERYNFTSLKYKYQIY